MSGRTSAAVQCEGPAILQIFRGETDPGQVLATITAERMAALAMKGKDLHITIRDGRLIAQAVPGSSGRGY